MHKNIIILSLDSFDTSDFEKIKYKESFKYLTDNGSFCRAVKSVYPSLTYPAHTTIITGKLPRNHGVINNTKFEPGNDNPDWFWFRNEFTGETLYEIAKKKNKTVASLLWPVTGRSNIKYNLPEIFPNKKFQSQVSQIIKAGSVSYCLELDSKFRKLRNGISQPELDNFVHESALYTYEKYNPYMMLVHYVELDYMKHHYGVNSAEYEDALENCHNRVNSWINLLKSKGLLEETLLIVLGDHSHKKVSQIINMNVFLRKLGLIEYDEVNKKIKNYKAYAKSADGSAYIYIKGKDREKTLSLLQDNLTVLSAYEENGIKFFVDGNKASLLGADSRANFMLEAAEGYHFGESLDGEFIEQSNIMSTHGFSPDDENYKTTFFAVGPGVFNNNEIYDMNL